MKPGSVVVLRMPRLGRAPGKIRPAVVLAELPAGIGISSSAG